MFCCASGGPYRLNTAGSKQVIPHCMRRHFRVALVRVDRTLHLQKIPAGSSGQQRMHVSRLVESAYVFFSGTVGYEHGSVPRYFEALAITPSILSLLLACLGRRRERTQAATAVLAGRVAQVDMTRRFGENFRTSNLRDQRKLRHSAMPTGGPKIDSGENCFPLKVANQLASYFYTSPGPIRIVVSKQPS